jgi:hypothetical protein
MVTRIKDQVNSFVAYGGYKEGMSVGEIIKGARVDRLVNKELEKATSGIILDLVEGKMANQLVAIPSINWQTEKYNIRGCNAIEIANSIEQSLELII